MTQSFRGAWIFLFVIAGHASAGGVRFDVTTEPVAGGLKVKAVAISGLGKTLGIKPGDVLHSLDKTGLKTEKDLAKALASLVPLKPDAKLDVPNLRLKITRAKQEKPVELVGWLFQSTLRDKSGGATYYFWDQATVNKLRELKKKIE